MRTDVCRVDKSLPGLNCAIFRNLPEVNGRFSKINTSFCQLYTHSRHIYRHLLTTAHVAEISFIVIKHIFYGDLSMVFYNICKIFISEITEDQWQSTRVERH